MLLLLLVGGRSYAASCNYSAQTAIGKYAGALCFFDLSDYRDATASSAAGQDFTLTLPTGGTFSFNLKRTNGTASGGGTPNAPLAAVAMPSWGSASLGNNNWYAGVPGRPVLYQSSNRTTSILTFSNFVITRPDGTSFPNFDFIAIDGETTSAPTESFSLRTDGSAWREIDRSGSNITYSGLGTQDVSWRSPGGNASAPILQSHSPTQVVATLVGGGRQGMSFAIAATSLIVEKTVADPYGTGLGRARAGDQFALAVTNTSGATFDQQGQATTTGNASGKQTAKARALIYFSGSVNIGESMASGSTSNVAAYDPTTTCISTSGETTNLPVDQPGASVELTTLDPLHFDLVRCTITNTIPRPQVSIDKSSSAASVPPGGSLAYTITVTNTGEVPADGTVVRDDVPAGISTFNWTCDAEHGAVCPNGSGSGAINETIATLPPGGRIVYRIDAIVSWDPPSNIVNTSTADPPHGACYPNDSAPPCAATVTNTPAPVIGIGKRLDCDGSGGGGSSGGRGGSSANGCGGGDGGGGARDGTSFNGAATVQEGAVPGSTVTYFLDVYNNSSVAADGTVVDDPIGPGLTTPFTWTCVAYGGAVCPNDSGSGAIHETLTTFPAWGWITYTITATVDANPPNPIVNRATAVPPAGGVCNSGIGGLLLGGEVEGSTSCEASVETPPAPQVAVSKSAEPSGALTPGGTVTYTITASNGGSVDAPNTHVVDEFPDGIAEATWTCTASGGAVCPADDSGGTVTPPATMLDQTIATFPPGSALTWTVTGTVNPDPPAQVVNTVSATPPDGGVCLPDNTPAPCDATVMNPPGPIVDIAKSADASVLIPGGTVTYTVTVRNTGTVAADGTTLDDPLPTGIAEATWTCSAEGGAVCPEASGTGAVAATITTFPPGSRLVYTIVATVDDNPPSPSVANTATITPPAGGVCDSSAPRPCDATTVLPVAPQIELTKTSEPAEAVPGGTLTWTVTVTNTGQADAAGTLIDDPVPSGIDSASVSWSCAASGGAVCPNASGSGGLNESVDTFPPGGRLVYTITAIVPAEPPTTIHNIAAATPPGEGRCMPGNTLPPCHADTATPSAANVSLAKAVADASGDGVAEPGETLTYTIVLSNSGGAAAVDYGVTDPLDANTTFVSASDGGVLSGGTVTWSGLSVPAGGTLTLTLVVTVNDPIPSGVAQIANLAYLTGETPPDCSVTPRPAGCTAIPTIGAVEIAKSVVDASGNGVAEPGETLTYTIALTNRGGSDVTGYGLLDPLDAHTTFVSASDGGALSGSTVSWSGLDIPAGASLSLTVVVTVNTPLPPGVTQIGNLAYQEGTVPPDCSAVPKPTSCTSIPTPGTIAIAKSVVDENGDGYAEAGEQLVYTIELTNVGGSEVTDYGVTDPLDANTTFVSASDGGLHSGGIVTWSGLTIAAGGSLTLNVVVTVNSPIPADVTQIFNLAYASGDAPPDCTAMPRPANCTDIFTIQFPAHVTIAKSASSDDLAPGAHVVYTVTVRNVGGSAATNVVVSDPIPAGIDAFVWTCAASGGAACPNAVGSGALAETIANLPGGGELVYTIDATIAADPPASVVNTAGVTLPDGTCSPCSSTVVGQVQVPSQIRPVPVADRWALWLLALLLTGFAGHGLVARRRRC